MLTAGIVSFGAGATQWTGKRAKNTLGQGCSIVLNCCRAAGIEVVDLHEEWKEVDVLMVGLYWWEHALDLVNLLAANGVSPWREKRAGKPLVFLGGQLVSYNPSVFRDIVDLCCIGDGEDVAPAALSRLLAGARPRDCADVPGVYVSELDNQAEWQQFGDISSTSRWPFCNMTRSTRESGLRQREEFERRLEIARGCRGKCAFCGLGWTKKYRELPTELAVQAVLETPGCVKSFAPDYQAHSGWPQIADAYRRAGKFNQARDISTKQILEHGFGTSHAYSTGIDGLSERLRRALAKPLSCDDLIEVVERASGHMGSLGMYQILDLPEERLDDYEEWFRALARAKLRSRPDSGRFNGPEGGFYILATLNAFCPTPHTPLQWEGITLEPSCYDRYVGSLDILGPKESRPLQHKILGRPHGEVSRLLESSIVRGSPELTRLVVAMAKLRSKMKRARDVFAIAARLGLVDALRVCIAPRSVDEPLPWEQRVKPLHARDVLFKARARFHRIASEPARLQGGSSASATTAIARS